MQSNRRGRILHSIAAASILGVGGLILSFATSNSKAADSDFIAYWCAGKQLLLHRSPYDGPVILKLEHSFGSPDIVPAFMRNPPIAFFMTLPLGLVTLKVGEVLWSLAIIAALMVSIRMLWTMFAEPKDSLHLFGYLFAPALACLLAGQTGVFVLLGVVLFLFCNENKPFAAGASLLLLLLKPHLLIPFGAVLIIWSITSRKYRILIGACCSVASSLLLSFLFDPHGWSQYAQMVNAERLQNLAIPTISVFFRLIVHREWVWLQAVPSIVGTIWGIWYFARNRETWNWRVHGLPLLLVSVMVAPYAWFTDEAIVLPAILASLYIASSRGRSLVPFGVIAGIALIEILAGVPITSWAYLWTSPAWLIWYLWASRPLTSLEQHNHDIALLPARAEL